MKRLSIIFIFLLIIFCSSCKEKIVGVKLNKPNVVINGNELTWEKDLQAKKYQIITNKGTIYSEYTIFFIDSGVTFVKIKAVGDGKYYLDSEYNYITTNKNSEDL